MLQGIPGIRSVTWQEQSNGPVAAGSNNLKGVNVLGLSSDWILTQGGTIVAGRNFTDLEVASAARVAVINDRLARDLLPGLDPVGKRIKIFGAPFDVVGLYSEPKSLFGDSESPYVAIPHSTFIKVSDYWKGWMMFSVIPQPELTVAEAQDRVTAALRAYRGLKPAQDNNFSLVSQDKLLDSFNSVTQGFFLVMLALSSVGLMVGGVGVVAIMMISVTERTREIGVRKALGATRREIMFQFLVEAATLTLVGGVAGMVLGGLIALGVNKLTPIPAAVPLWSVVLAVVASTITGICFGLYPASKASKLDPVEALRYE
jgi:putative ABC transport system permease protein